MEHEMEKTNFEKLRVYKLAESLADGIWAVVLGWDYLAKVTVGKQMIRAADSIGANIAEGTGRGSLQDNRRFIRMARVHHTKHSTGSAVRINELFSVKDRSKH